MAKRRRLKRTRTGNIILQNGQIVSQDEYRQFVNRVNRANRKRAQFLNNLDAPVAQSYMFDKEKGGNFVPTKKSASISRFRNRTEFLAYNAGLKRLLSDSYGRTTKGGRKIIHHTNYFDRKIDIYRKNLDSALKKVFNSAGDDLRKFVKSLSNEELRELTMKEEFNDIGFVYYDTKKASDKLNELYEQVEAIRARKKKGK